MFTTTGSNIVLELPNLLLSIILKLPQTIHNTLPRRGVPTRQAPTAGYTSSSPDTSAITTPITDTVPITRPQ